MRRRWEATGLLLGGVLLAAAAMACGESPSDPPPVTVTADTPSPAAAPITPSAAPTAPQSPATDAPPRLPTVNLRAGGPIGRVTATPTASPVITAPPDFAPPPAAPGAAAAPVSIQADLERALELLRGGDLEEARKVFESAATAAPDDPRPLMGMALADQFAGDLEGALAEATRAVELAPEFLPALITRADIHLALGNAAAAAEDYTAAVRIEPLNASAHLGHGRALAAQGDLAGAVDALTRAIDISGNNTGYLIERARLYMAMEDIDAAINDLEQAKAASPDDPRPALVLALTLQGNGDLERALAEATYAVEIAPEFLPSLFTRGDIRLALGDAMGAAEDYGAAARIDPLNPLAHAGQAQSLSAQGDVEGAIEALTRALDIAGDHPDYLAERARLYLDLQNIEPALADLERAVAAAPERLGVRLLYADVLRFAERLDDALAVVNALIEDEPGLPLAYELRASIRMSLGDEPGALEDLAVAIAIDPSDASAYAARALLHHQAERYQEAIADYDRSLELRPNDAGILNNRADARMLLGDLDLALEDIEAAVAANPELGIAHYTRGQILDELGRAEEAQAAYEEAARLGYEPPEDVG